MHVRLKGVKSYKVGDRVYHYHRDSGRRLSGAPGTPEFTKSLEDAEASMTKTDGSTLGGLIYLYTQSQDWEKLRESTKEIARLNLRAVENKFGTMPLAAFADKRVRAVVLRWRDELAKKHPRAADAKVSAMARVLSWGLDRGLVDDNPLDGVKRAYKSDRTDKIWLPEHIAAFEAHAGPELCLAMMLALHTGQRQGDLLRLPWSAYDGAAISLVQSKGRRRVWIPCTVALRTVLDAAPRRSTNIITNTYGHPWEKRAFIRAWERAFKAAGLTDDLHFHDLRGTAVTMLAEAGCTPPEIATITGHTFASVSKILETYLSRTRALATAAITKLEEWRKAK